jgi:hypothetical protein
MKNKNNIEREIKWGINGSGQSVWIVFTINTDTGRVLGSESFTSEAEAEAWVKWA